MLSEETRALVIGCALWGTLIAIALFPWVALAWLLVTA